MKPWERFAGQESAAIGFSWLLLLRWGAFGSLVMLVLAIYFLTDIYIPFKVVSAILVFQVGSNLFLALLKTRKSVISERLLACIMFFDVLLMTLLLYFTGGAMNPFTFLYLIHIVLAAILLRTHWVWSLTVFTIFCYAAVFYQSDSGGDFGGGNTHDHIVVPGIESTSFSMLEDHMSMHLQGMWVAFTITAIFIIYFVGQIRKSLELQQVTLARLEDERNKSERMASLATLAAGAAHEFATPLSTIAVASGEMLHMLQKESAPPALLADLKLIRQQVARCKEILFQMAADAGEQPGENNETVSLNALLKNVSSQFIDETGRNVVFAGSSDDLFVGLPPRTVSRIVYGLLKNGADASPEETPIRLSWRLQSGKIMITVADIGTGMDAETCQRAMEPFYTTKEPGRGLGLGLYLAKSVAERLGGGLVLDSSPGKGTVATLSLAAGRPAPL